MYSKVPEHGNNKALRQTSLGKAGVGLEGKVLEQSAGE